MLPLPLFKEESSVGEPVHGTWGLPLSAPLQDSSGLPLTSSTDVIQLKDVSLASMATFSISLSAPLTWPFTADSSQGLHLCFLNSPPSHSRELRLAGSHRGLGFKSSLPVHPVHRVLDPVTGLSQVTLVNPAVLLECGYLCCREGSS